MKYIYQFAIILIVAFISELLNFLIDLPIPASVYGLILMTILLSTKILDINKVRDTAKYLVKIMQIMFIPSAVSIVVAFDDMKELLIPIIVISTISTIVVMIVTGKVSDFIIYGGKSK